MLNQPRAIIQRTLMFVLALLVILSFNGCSGGSGSSGTTNQQQTPASTPAFNPLAGTYTSSQSVTITDSTPGATIYYTTDGSTPSTASSVYSAAIPVSTTTTIKAIATASGYTQSSAVLATYTIQAPSVATPTFTPVAGTYTSAQSVSIADSTSGSTIYYTTDGSTPSTTSNVYSVAIPVNATTTIKAIAAASGYSQSATASGIFTIIAPTVATPTVSPAAGVYTSGQTVTLSDATLGSTIYYTTDGSTPTTASNVYTSAIVVSATATIKAIAVAPGYSQGATTTATYAIQSGSSIPVSVVLTSSDSSKLLAVQPTLQFASGTASANTPTIVVDESQTYQTVEGFGADFTDTTGYLLNEVAPVATRNKVMNDLFTRNGNGIGISFIRNPMGASDLARTMYSYDDGLADPTLANFSIVTGDQDVLPLTVLARQLNPDLKIMANPWSPPGWMKTNGTMIGQLNGGTQGSLMSSMYPSFANYFVKYLQAYAAAGVDIDYISLQNEPLYAPTNYPGMLMSAAQQTTVLRDNILQPLTAAGLNTRVLVYDHNWDTPSFPETVLADPTIAASSQVAGVAWHGYGGTPGAMGLLHNQFPTFGQYMTEHSGGTWVSNQGQSDFEEITQVMRNWGKAYVKWSLAVNENLGPHDGGCGDCSAPITINSTSGAATYDIEYYTLGQYSKFILPGATRVYSSNATGLISSAYVNPDGSKALVVFNDTTATVGFQVQWGDQTFSYSLPTYTAATFTWYGTQDTPNTTHTTLNAKSQIPASSYSSVNGFETETTGDVNGGFDLGYSVSGSTAVFKNVDFGSGVSGVNVRLACYASQGTCGGTVEFHLDSATGTLAASTTVPSTGGWQTWQTAAGTVSGTVNGVHDVYIIINAATTSTSGVGNMNWFQFN